MGGDTLNWSTDSLPKVLKAGLFVCPGFGTHPDRVIRQFELIFVRRGTLCMYENDRQLSVQKDQTLILWPGRKHGGLRPYTPNLTFYWIHFLLPETSNREVAIRMIPQVADLEYPERLAELFRRFVHDLESDHLGPFEASLMMALMLVEVSRRRRECVRSSDHAGAIAEKVEEYIAHHLGDGISTAIIAEELGFNADYLSRVFRKGSGASITETIHRRRIDEAQFQLSRSTRTVSQVAYSCGYRDVGYFRRLFKRHAGVTPLEFRNLYYRVRINTH